MVTWKHNVLLLLAFLLIKVFWFQSFLSIVHFIKLRHSRSCHAWLCATSTHGTVYISIHFSVSKCMILYDIDVCNIVVYSAKFFRYISERTTVNGIWFLVLITYVYTADTCLNLLRCVQVYEPIEFNGKRVSIYIFSIWVYL